MLEGGFPKSLTILYAIPDKSTVIHFREKNRKTSSQDSDTAPCVILTRNWCQSLFRIFSWTHMYLAEEYSENSTESAREQFPNFLTKFDALGRGSEPEHPGALVAPGAGMRARG